MKKVVTLFLTAIMLLNLCACAGGGENTDQPEENALQVGYAKVNVTPNYAVSLSGYSDDETRISDGYVEPIYATCLALTQAEETILVFTLDSLSVDHAMAESFRGVLKTITGIPMEKVFFGATHGHNCPSKSGQYKEDLHVWLVQAAVEALENRAPVTMLAGTKQITGMNFVRHYKMADGNYFGSNFGKKTAEVVGHAADADTQMVLVKFDYIDESKKDILLVNWQAHPDWARAIGYNQICPSFVGPLRDQLENLTGMHVAYFTGASGNTGADSQLESETHGLTWRDYGIEMGNLARGALSCLQPVTGTGIRTARRMITVDIDHSWDHMIQQANEVYTLWKSNGMGAGRNLLSTYGFSSVYQARAIRTRYASPTTTELEINAFSVCGVGFTTGTYEMFSTSAMYVKENSPFDITFIIAGNQNYIPDPPAYDYRSYEADTSLFAKGTAEKLTENYVEMLELVK